MKSALKALLAACSFVVILGGIGLVAVYHSDDMVEMREFEKQFALVKVGDSEAKALSLLGTPDAKESHFRIGQVEGFEEAYSRAKASGSTYYLVWSRGIDVVFSLGVDSKGFIRAKESGGT